MRLAHQVLVEHERRSGRCGEAAPQATCAPGWRRSCQLALHPPQRCEIACALERWRPPAVRAAVNLPAEGARPQHLRGSGTDMVSSFKSACWRLSWCQLGFALVRAMTPQSGGARQTRRRRRASLTRRFHMSSRSHDHGRSGAGRTEGGALQDDVYTGPTMEATEAYYCEVGHRDPTATRTGTHRCLLQRRACSTPCMRLAQAHHAS